MISQILNRFGYGMKFCSSLHFQGLINLINKMQTLETDCPQVEISYFY